eukprot:1654941-Pyramimonas_sp.AAC.1
MLDKDWVLKVHGNRTNMRLARARSNHPNAFARVMGRHDPCQRKSCKPLAPVGRGRRSKSFSQPSPPTREYHPRHRRDQHRR